MSDDTISPTTVTAATDEDGRLLLSAPEADALLRKCFGMIKEDLHLLVEMSIETTNDLFEANEYVKDDAALAFRQKRGEWLTRFDKALADGWGDLDIACVHDQISGASALTQEGPS